MYSHVSPKPMGKICYDWVFSSATNVHIAIDKSAFKTYTPFKSYVLTVADKRQVSVRGVGTVELKILRQPGSKESHVIVLENVLHVPSWLCNILSDTYFSSSNRFTHTWSEFGVSFYKKEGGDSHPWGFTENFCALDRLALARNMHGRSPMLEDPDREVFSVNVTWPQSQRDMLKKLVAEHMKMAAQQHEARLKEQTSAEDMKVAGEVSSDLSGMSTLAKGPRAESMNSRRERRSALAPINGNMKVFSRKPSGRTSSLKGPLSVRGSFKEQF